MDFKSFKCGPDDNSRRLDKVIRKFIPQISLTLIYKYIRKGLIKVNLKKSSPKYHINENDEINIASFILETKQEEKEISKDIKLPPIIFRNEHILIIDKPYNVTVHGFDDSLDKLIVNEYKKTNKNNSLSFVPGPLHRLDKLTTGLLAFSQSLEGAKWFSENIKNHIITKKYIAVIQGELKDEQEWKDLITKDKEETKGFHTVKAEISENNNAHTIIKPVSYGKYKNKSFTLAEIEIKTGKTHQIRAQSSLHGFPLLGDTAYNGIKIESKYPSFFLQAFYLSFPKENPLNLPSEIKIEYSDQLKNFLKDCYVK